MTTSIELEPPLPPKTKVRRYLWALILSGLSVYFFLPRFAAMGHALLVISNLRVHFVVLSIAAQLLSYAGSGYLLSTAVKLAAKPVSVVDGALITTGANSVGTLGGAAWNGGDDVSLASPPRCKYRRSGPWQLASHSSEQHCVGHRVPGRYLRHDPSKEIIRCAYYRLHSCVFDSRWCRNSIDIVPALPG